MKDLAVTVAFAPLVGALIAGLGARSLPGQQVRKAAIFSVLLSFLAACVVFGYVLNGETFNGTVYRWITLGDGVDKVSLEIGFLIDPLTALMMVVVTFVSLMVHVYTIGY